MNSLLRLLLLAMLISSTQSTAETFTIRSDKWYPINGEPDQEYPGYMIELAKEILLPRGISVDYQITPWARALVSVRNGSNDCVVGAYKTDAPDFVFPELAWGMDQNIFYVKKDNPWRFIDYSSLLNIRVGLIHEYSYNKELDDFINRPENKHIFDYTFSKNALEQNIIKVLAGRLTTTIESQLVMPEKLKQLGLQDVLVPAGKMGNSVPMYIACSPVKPSSAIYIKWFDEGISNLRKSGRLTEILAKYQLKDWLE